MPPPKRKRGAENVVYQGQGLSPAASAAEDAGQIWDLFFTPEILNIIVRHTNRYLRKATTMPNKIFPGTANK
jgi:hypothetical protein